MTRRIIPGSGIFCEGIYVPLRNDGDVMLNREEIEITEQMICHDGEAKRYEISERDSLNPWRS
jgi:hypothetical protein